jgi:putative endonuclease
VSHARSRGIGLTGEHIAAQLLESKGYKIFERNWHAAGGELDLVAQDGDTIVVVEVKTRSGRGFGLPEDAMTQTKRRRLLHTAWTYLEQNNLLDAAWRVDVIAVEIGRGGAIERVEHYQNVVEDDPEARK